MKNYEEVVRRFHGTLAREDWPQTLWVTTELYWDVIIAADGEIKPDWHFHPTGEDEGFPFFLIGGTMVRPIKQTNTATITNTEVKDARNESEGATESGVRP